MNLRDLNGGTLDLAALPEAADPALFWNPTCGYCEAMLDDLKAWESNRPKDALELVVISAGSPKGRAASRASFARPARLALALALLV